jgi:hypothetical protein
MALDNDKNMEQYVLLATKAKGFTLVDLIQRATSEDGVYGFGELLSVPVVQQVFCRRS